jgi:DNA-binding GntR family transcriptional regulator
VVAEQLGVSNGTVSDAIQALIYRGIFKQQIEGQIVEK